MKKNIWLERRGPHLFVCLLSVLMALFLFNCEGPTGADGQDGVDGTDGTDGVDGNVTCLGCHTIAKMTAVDEAYELSSHSSNGWTLGYAGGRQGCAMCHSHEGFVETQHTGMDTTHEDIPIPTRIDCETCHAGHVSFDFENDGQDYALRTVAAVDFKLMGDSTNMFDYGTSNLCVNCHQPRKSWSYYDTNLSSDSVYLSSPYGTPHYGTQSTVLMGLGGDERLVGSVDITTIGPMTHASATLGCTGCHMHEGANETEGGHTWNPSVEACVNCHTSATDFDINGRVTTINSKKATLLEKLKTEGILDADGDAVVGTYYRAVYSAYWNYKTVYYDHSGGVHNPDFVEALLDNGIAALP